VACPSARRVDRSARPLMVPLMGSLLRGAQCAKFSFYAGGEAIANRPVDRRRAGIASCADAPADFTRPRSAAHRVVFGFSRPRENEIRSPVHEDRRRRIASRGSVRPGRPIHVALPPLRLATPIPTLQGGAKKDRAAKSDDEEPPQGAGRSRTRLSGFSRSSRGVFWSTGATRDAARRPRSFARLLSARRGARGP
jgi:hypothetical protein